MGRYGTTKFENIAKLEAIVLGMDTAKLEDVQVAGKNREQFKAVVNQTTQHIEAIVSDRYTLIQHREVFEPVIVAMRNLGVRIQGKVTRDGGRIYADILFNDDRFKHDVSDDSEKGDIINFGMRFFNSYDKTTSFGAEVFAMRLVCKNGMIRPVNIKSIREIHSGNKRFVVKAIANLFKSLAEESPKFADVVSRAREEIVTLQMMKELFATWHLGKKHVKVLMQKIRKLDEKNQWNIYNVLTDYITHNMEVREATKEKWHKQYANQILHAPIPALIQKSKERI